MTRKPRGSNPRNLTPEQQEHKRQRAREYYWENADECRRKKREEAAADRSKARKMCAEYYEKNRDKVLASEKERSKMWSEEYKEKKRKRGREYHERNKELVSKRKKEERVKHPDRFNNEKSRARCREYGKNNREKIMKKRKSNPEKIKETRLKPYGMTIKQYDELLASQGGKCAICGMSDASNCKMFPIVDHCHTNNHVRGLLCGQCNRGIGMFKDSPALLRKAAEYIERNGLFGPLSMMEETGRNDVYQSNDNHA